MLPVIQGFSSALPGSAALPIDAIALAVDPSVLIDSPAPVRAVGSFVLVLVFGGALCYRFEEFVAESVESSMERPLVSTLYGVAALAAIVYLGFYAFTQATAIGPDGTAADVAIVAVGVVVVTLASLGFTVVGTRLLQTTGEHRRWPGLLAGAAISAAPWLLPWFVPGLLAWAAIGGMGIGGPARSWIQASESVETVKGSE